MHDKHSGYALGPENKSIKKEWLNGWQQEEYHETTNKKLITSFHDKIEYGISYRTLQLYLRQGLELVTVHRVLQFNQAPYLKDYLELNTNARKGAKNGFESNFYKLMKILSLVRRWKILDIELISNYVHLKNKY